MLSFTPEQNCFNLQYLLRQLNLQLILQEKNGKTIFLKVLLHNTVGTLDNTETQNIILPTPQRNAFFPTTL